MRFRVVGFVEGPPVPKVSGAILDYYGQEVKTPRAHHVGASRTSAAYRGVSGKGTSC